jgi:hypothetical protein
MPKAVVDDTGPCRMCWKSVPLERSHIVPALIIRWLKETAALPSYLRTGANPNMRVQDGWRRRLLCRECEDAIGRFERPFAEQLFPLIVTEAPVPYAHGPWLSRLVASLAWRTLTLFVERGMTFDFLTTEQRGFVHRALEHWRAFVRGEANTPRDHELHFVPLSGIAEYRGTLTLPANFNRYIMRAIEIDVTGRDREALVYVKMGPAVALGFIQQPEPDTWRGTRVALGDGHVGGTMGLPGQFLDYLIRRAEAIEAAQHKRSPRQREKAREAFLANPDRAAASETMRALRADVEMFGAERVWPKQPDRRAT